MRKYLNFLLLLFMTVLSADAYEVLVVKTGEIVTSRGIPSVKKTETREDYKITVTYQFDSLLVVRDEDDKTKIRFEIDGFGIIQNSSSPALPFIMDQYAMDSLSVAYLQGYTSETYDVHCNLAYSKDPATQNNNADSTTQVIKVVNSFKPGDIISSDNSQYCFGDPGLCVYWDNNTDLSELVTRSDLPGRTIISGTRMVNVAIYDSVADVAYRVYTKDYTHRTPDPVRVKVTVSLPGCKPVELPTTAHLSSYPRLLRAQSIILL